MNKPSTNKLQKVLATLLTVAALFAGQNAWAQDQSFPTSSGGSGTSSNPYLIKTTADLNALASDVNSGTNYFGKYFKLDNDIDFQPTTAWNDTTSTENNFTAIGNNNNVFSGHFDGDGHTISGIRIYKDATDATANYQGLFGYTFNGNILNVTLTDARITGNKYVGGIVGCNHVKVQNCHVSTSVAIHAVVSQTNAHGGIAGQQNGMYQIINCTSAATVSIAYGITNCINYGGIVGDFSRGTIKNCLAVGATVNGSNSTGAIVGSYSTSNSTFTSNYYRNCIVNGNTTNVGTNNGDLIEGARGIGILTATTGVTVTGETNGTVVIDNTTYHYGGQTITFTYSGEIPTGHFLGVVTASGSIIEVTAAGDDTYTFTMPAEDVTVTGPIITWASLQAALDAASTYEENPTLITLSNDVVAASTDSRLIVPYNKHVIIDLNGYAIDRHLSEPASYGEVIFVRGSGNSSTNGPGHLTIRDSSNPSTGRITGGYAQNNCGGVLIAGFFTLESGSICGNKAPQMAAGVYVNSGGTFTMTGGSITNNTIDSDGNLASAIYMYPTGTTFNMSGGTISGNHGGQWAIEIKNNFNLSGTYDISGNTKNDNTAACDIYCLNNSRITITDPISPVHPSTVRTSQTVLTNGWSTYMGSTDPATCFTPFESNKVLVVADGEVKVIIGTRVESITVTPAEIYPTVGDTYSIVFTVLPDDATNPAVTFSSSDENVATVDENGTVTAVAAGTATITIAATDGSGVTGTLTVNVMNIDVEEITAQDITISTGQTATINYQVLPEQATDKSVTFTSANTAIATVDENGVVTGLGVGKTTITIASVQNPDVTTDITVTVISNPYAVQFTVNIDKTSVKRGDVITVEAYLNAPESGEYNGFTGLVLGLHFDPTAFEVNGNPVADTVANACTIAMPGLPNATHPDLVQYTLAMPVGTPNTTTGLVFTVQFTVLTDAEFGSYTFYAEPTSASNFVYNPGSGASLILYEYVPSIVGIMPVFTKDINAHSPEGQPVSGWYLIASPVADAITPTVDNGFLANEYDLYRFNQAPTANSDGEYLEWENWKSQECGGGHYHFNIESGRGYLYANSENVTLNFIGAPYDGDGIVPLSYTAGADFEGWNLVGNPFAVDAYIVRPYYTMNGNRTGLIAEPQCGPAIPPMEGVFVIAEEEGEYLTFSTEAPGKGANLALNVSRDRGSVIDRAIVNFGEGGALPKFQLFGNRTKVYIPQGGKDYAVVSVDNMGEIPVHFKAEENGTYTLTVSSTLNSQFSTLNYLHLIDNMTGADVDLLSAGDRGSSPAMTTEGASYTFEAKTTDYESRFKLVFSICGDANGDNDGDNEAPFAYINDGNIIVNGEGMLQVVDVMGRVIHTCTVTPNSSLHTPNSTGVYVLRLIDGDNVRTQKIVVR